MKNRWLSITLPHFLFCFVVFHGYEYLCRPYGYTINASGTVQCSPEPMGINWPWDSIRILWSMHLHYFSFRDGPPLLPNSIIKNCVTKTYYLTIGLHFESFTCSSSVDVVQIFINWRRLSFLWKCFVAIKLLITEWSHSATLSVNHRRHQIFFSRAMHAAPTRNRTQPAGKPVCDQERLYTCDLAPSGVVYCPITPEGPERPLAANSSAVQDSAHLMEMRRN